MNDYVQFNLSDRYPSYCSQKTK